MISDALAEAVYQIDLYLSDTTSSTAYVGPIRDRLVWLRNGMELVRQELDRPPAQVEPNSIH